MRLDRMNEILLIHMKYRLNQNISNYRETACLKPVLAFVFQQNTSFKQNLANYKTLNMQ